MRTAVKRARIQKIAALFPILFLWFARANELASEENLPFLTKNVVKISTRFSDGNSESGFGFIVFETKDSLYAATAKHVVFLPGGHSPPKEIRVSFYGMAADAIATVAYRDPVLDLAIIRFEKLPGFEWQYGDAIKQGKLNDKVRIIGGQGRWILTASRSSGVISKISDNEIRAKFTGAAVGSSGGPLLSRNKIVGMVTEDEGELVTAIPIKVIQQKAAELKNIAVVDPAEFSYWSVGLWGGTSAVPRISITQTSTVKETFNLGYGASLEFTVSPHLSIRTKVSYRSYASRTDPRFGPDYRFRNNFSSLSFLLCFRPLIVWSNVNYFTLNFGYSASKLHPEINVEETGWIELNSLQGANHNYSSIAHSLLGGMDIQFLNFASDYFVFLNMDFEYFMNNYLTINVERPYQIESGGGDWLMTLRIKVVYLFQSNKSNVKLLR